MPGSRLKKIFIIVFCVLAAFVVSTILLLSPLTKYLLEKHDTELFARNVKLGWVYVNPFTGYVHLSDVKIFEEKGDSLFIAAAGASASFNLSKLFKREVEIAELTVTDPQVSIVQKKDVMNFDDIIRHFSPDSVTREDTEREKTGAEKGFHVTILTIHIINGLFRYRDKIIPIDYSITDVNIESEGKPRYVDTIAANFRFKPVKGTGEMNGAVTVNVKNADYRLGVNVTDFDLEIIRQYIWELINYGMFRAHVDANIRAKGNFHSRDSITTSGHIVLRDFHLGRTSTEDYVSFTKLVLGIEELSPHRKKYEFDSITLHNPFVKYEIYDTADNVETLFGKHGSNITDVTRQRGRFNLVIEIARYVKVLARNFFRSNYKINRLAIVNGDFRFNDFSLNEKFSMDARPLTIIADSINRKRRRVELTFKSALKPYGDLALFLSINPKDTTDFDLKYHLEKVPASIFNPYLITHTSFPVDRGTIELSGTWNVRNGNIKSDNHLVVVDPRISKRLRNKDTKWIPMPLIMAFVRERGNVIDYEVPITGNLKNPKFHLRDAVLDLVKNIFVKPATTPYRMEVKLVENEIEKAVSVKWETKRTTLAPHQEKFVRKMSEFLKKNPRVSIRVHPVVYAAKEKEYILNYEAKKKFFLLSQKKHEKDFTQSDSIAVDKMSVKDASLVKRVSRGLSDTVMLTMPERLAHFVGRKTIEKKFEQLNKSREKFFMSFFVKDQTNSRVKIMKRVTDIPYNGFSYFRIEYDGEIPVELQKAYREMLELNDEVPRKKYLRTRRKDPTTPRQVVQR
jgi:hypothetical protein